MVITFFTVVVVAFISGGRGDFSLTDAGVSFVRDSRRARCLHNRLIAMHVLASFAQVLALAKYVIPPSDVSCLLTHRFMVAFLLFYDVSNPLSATATMMDRV